MEKNVTRKMRELRWALLLLFGLFSAAAQAQSGPYGNEWIVPSQQYYKVQVTRDGIHRLSFQYLTQAGLSNIDPSRLQLWRRGRQVAVFQGGAPTVFDTNTYLEFYGQRNDGQLDGNLYKNTTDQPHQLYSFYTDTAAYFLTYPGATAPAAKRMAQPVAAGGTPHAWRLATSLKLETNLVSDAARGSTFLPWVEPGEGYFSLLLAAVSTTTTDSVLRAVVSTTGATAPRLEVGIVGGTFAPHNIELLVLNTTTNVYRSLDRYVFTNYNKAGGKYILQPGEVGPNGLVTIRYSASTTGTGTSSDYYRRSFIRVVAPQANRWLGPRRQLAFASDSLLGGPATFEVDSIPASVVGYDIHDPWNVQRIAPTAATTLGALGRRFVFPSATAGQSRRLLLADTQLPFVPLPARPVRFRAINAATVNFAIVSHRQLYGPALDGTTPVTNAAREYAKYRASTAGGSYDTLLVTASQLYDQFHYGERSWLALRHFGLWLAAGNPNNPDRYLLLLGKGIVPSEPLIAGSNRNNLFTATTARGTGERGVDLIPTSTRAVSDNMITADFQNNDFIPKLRTGRLTVVAPQQIMNYLGKLRTHDALGPEPWRKNVLHLVGGINAGEMAWFRSIMDRNKQLVERPLFGGRVSSEYRTNVLPVSLNISSYLNEGLSLITYFGHGSNNRFSLDFGVPSDPTNNYNNIGRYPIFFLNGCEGIHSYTAAPTILEDWLFTPQKGAIGALGEYGLSYPDRLEIAADTIYKLMFSNPQTYGKPITAVYADAVRRLQSTPYFTDDIGMEQLLGTGWHGDPTLALFAPERPDFIASAATMSVTPAPGQGPVKASSTEFVLNVGVSNPGKVTFDPLEIRITRTYSASSGRTPQVYSLYTQRQAWRRDTTYAFTLPNTLAEAGVSTFRVDLDPNNRIAELSETNNTAQIDFTFLQGGLTVVNPTEFEIVNNAQPRLVVQNNDRNGLQRGYDFELDTVPTFNSGIRVVAPLITSGVIAEWRPVLPTVASRDSVVWYWRSRFHTPAVGEDGTWVTSSFRVIPTSPGGWSQSHHGQFKRTTRTGVDVSAPSGAWAFASNRIPLVMRTRGGGVVRSAPQFSTLIGAGIYLQSAGAPPTVSGCGVRSPNLLVAVYEPGGLAPVDMPATYQRCGSAPNYFYYFSASDPVGGAALDTLDNLNYNSARQQELAAFLAAVPAGSYVAVVSANRLRYSLLPAALKASLRTLLGSQLITQLADGEPLALVGQKLTASTGRLVRETGPDRTLTVAAYDQTIELRDSLQQRATAGRIVSPRIGPAKEWLSLYSTIRTLTPTAQRTLSVVAIDATGRETVVLPTVTSSAQALSTVSATQYPYLRLELALADSVTRVPPQLRQWLVTYRGLPEGVVRRDSVPATTYAAANLFRQATTGTGIISFPVKFQNVSNEAFLAPLKARVQLRNTGTNTVVNTQELTLTSPPLAAGAMATFNVQIDMKGRFGTFAIEVFVNPQLQPEQLYTNNELLLEPFTVNDNNVPPTLDVAFDGRHILNGDLVSPMPVINIQLSDEDKLRHISDRSVFTVTLIRPGSSTPTAVDLNGSNINFTVDKTNGSVAKLEYRPGLSAPLPDGMYTLRVQGRDPSNASAGSQDFQVKFEVVNASKITNVYPYPNPVVSKARFVFTVTGQELPRNMKIQIMTITGRVVREIFMNELGPLHIGNNITDYAWDGTDSYGDRLANGTYLYRVSLDDPNGQFGRRETAGDTAFKNDWGKLVLMR
ncbi:C25 family cysteine peptidase [Hymenobacter arizonensis]|uniref:Interleukin-like EMT inducer n=1 Tax=Hymenobacter arizonensis TaxID=1227077 RepID=A0A1I5V947_HYMAR|nr:C25 family cysteine peptidase [Hymenobacter arizonensis]SFQ04033.1 Interleukin-like EMT inducer [Hymenobacter arizonensis]